MIIARISGGLGNQMFQFAAGLALAKFQNTTLKVDLRGFHERNTHNGYELERVFGLDGTVAKSFEISDRLGIFRDKRLYSLLKRQRFFRSSKVYIEQSLSFHSSFFDLQGNSYIDGYFQSQKYFSSIEPDVRNIFSFKATFNEANDRLAEIIRLTNSVSVHVRRGDYEGNSFYAKNTYDYYNAAIDLIKTRTKNPIFFIFSDDPSWCRHFFQNCTNMKIISKNCGLQAFNDMALMTLCKHHINANSSFSWWGSYLAEYRDGITIVPSRWFSDGKVDHDIYLPSWLRL